MAERYPRFDGTRVPLAAAVRRGHGRVAGQLFVAPAAAGACRLEDESAAIALASVAPEAPSGAAWVSGELRRDADGSWRLDDVTVHAPQVGPSSDPQLGHRIPRLRLRADMIAAARAWFREAGFLEVETPTRVICPGLEPQLAAFPAGADRWLITSPELHLKRMLAAGAERVVEFARAFRDEERGPWHRSEFSMLEWYRSFAALDAIEADCEALVAACASLDGVDVTGALPDCDLNPPFERTTVREALRRHSGIDIAEVQQRDAFAATLADRRIAVQPGDDWDDLFFRVWIADVEPHLGKSRPVFVHDYPASQAALARTRRESWGAVAERFELYVNGVELANAFHELNDPVEQRARHEADRAARRAAKAPVHELDEPFLAALESGMPPAAGIALGLDRLIAVLLGAGNIDDVVAFP